MALKGVCATAAAILLAGAAFCSWPTWSNTFGAGAARSAGARSDGAPRASAIAVATPYGALHVADFGGRGSQIRADLKGPAPMGERRGLSGVADAMSLAPRLFADYADAPSAARASGVSLSPARLTGGAIGDAAEGLLDAGRFQRSSGAQMARLVSAPVRQSITRLVEFGAAPFPYEAAHRPYNDRRVLLHIPAGFDPRRPAVMVLFFHGHGATLERDVRDRQQVPEQITASGMNAVLVAPQFAVDAADSSVGRFSEPGAVARFMSEAADKLARLAGDPRAAARFAAMPIVIVGYSGGYLPTAYALTVGGLDRNRVRGVVLLDGVYGELDKFARWIGNNRSAFFISSFTHLTRRRNSDFERLLAGSGVAASREISPDLAKGGVTFVEADHPHRDYVTQAWAAYPIKDILDRLGDYRLNISPTALAHVDPAGPT